MLFELSSSTATLVFVTTRWLIEIIWWSGLGNRIKRHAVSCVDFFEINIEIQK